MTSKELPMAEGSIPVDVLNPGQVFACLGFLEAADQLLGDAEGAFDWSNGASVTFRLRARGDLSPIWRVLDFLDKASARAEAPAGSLSLARWTSSWGQPPTIVPSERGYPFPDPPSPEKLVCVLRADTDAIPLDHWGDATGRDKVKFWGGSGGYPGAARARDSLALVANHATANINDPFAFSAPQRSSFRLDWRRDYIPIDAGFSLNKHGDMQPVGYPLVELLAAIGLTHARPTKTAGTSRQAHVPLRNRRAHRYRR
jgi:CRISPR-associated protein Csx14